jgi:hypothetical protein
MVEGIDVQKIVDRISDECFEAHRGAFWWDEGKRVAIAFGNDGFSTDKRSRLEVEAVRRLVKEYGGKEIGFATDSEDVYSWAMAVTIPDLRGVDLIEGALWATWLDLGGKKGRHRAMVLNWPSIRSQLERGSFASVKDTFIGVQANIARAVLERAGLLN